MLLALLVPPSTHACVHACTRLTEGQRITRCSRPPMPPLLLFAPPAFSAPPVFPPPSAGRPVAVEAGWCPAAPGLPLPAAQRCRLPCVSSTSGLIPRLQVNQALLKEDDDLLRQTFLSVFREHHPQLANKVDVIFALAQVGPRRKP